MTHDLPPGRPSFITRVCEVDSRRFRVGQARRARSPQIAQAHDALDRILMEFVRRTPQLEESLFADQGIRLMHVDSQIAERVLRWCAIKDLPVLCVHDSFIIDHNHSLLLKHAMAMVSKVVLGVELAVTQNFPGLDGFGGEEARKSYADTRILERTEGYLERLCAHG